MRLLSQQLAGAAVAAEKFGYRLKEFWLAEPRMTESRFSDILHYQGVTGLFIAPTPGPRNLDGLKWDRFCAVASGYSVSSPELHRVAHDHHHAILVAFREAVALGYGRIGLAIGRRIQLRSENRWLAGFSLMQAEHRTLPRLPAFEADDLTLETFKAWMKRVRPDVVIFETIPAKLPVWLHSLRLDVPRDLGVIGLNVYELGDEQTGVCQVGREVGRTGLELLAAMVERHQVGLPAHPTTLLVKGVWNKGKTAPPRVRA